MTRTIITFVASIVTWIVVASVCNRLLRFGMPGYAVAEPTMAFTLGMMWARLGLGAAASLAAGWTAAQFAPTAVRLPVILGAALLLAFIPVHYGLWAKFPIWYHLVFLGSLIPLTWLGGWLGTQTRTTAEGKSGQ